MKAVVTINKLSKRYGKILAVNQLNLEIPEGCIFGILGPNGSGKTTTLGMLLDVVNPTSGTYQWFNNSSHKNSRKQIGAILENPTFYPYLTAAQNLKVVANIKNVGPQAIDEVLKKTGLYDRKDDKFKTYSLGMKQRLAIASALLCNPKVLILDEPTNGLDPQGIADVRKLIKDIASEGKTIILASHLLDEVQKVCTDFVVLKNGEKIHTGKVGETMEQASIELQAENTEQLLNIINNYEGTDSYKTKDDKILLRLKKQISPLELSKKLHKENVIITHFVTQSKNLEEQFLEILKKVEGNRN